MKETPEDVRNFLAKALPEERFHRETLLRLASPEDLEKFKKLHERALNAITSNRKEMRSV